MIDIIYEDWQTPVFFSYKLEDWCKTVCRKEGKELGELCIVLCSDQYLLEKNKEILNHDYYTDIITMEYNVENQVFGDLFISLDRVTDNAEKEAINVDDERDRVIVHGVLHLCGYGDKTDEEIRLMRSKEDLYLSLRNI